MAPMPRNCWRPPIAACTNPSSNKSCGRPVPRLCGINRCWRRSACNEPRRWRARMLPVGWAQETWQMWITRIMRHLTAFVLTTLIAGLIGATLVRFGPGFDADEQRLDPRLDVQSIQALHESHPAERNLPVFYLHYLEHMATGDLGFSRSLSRPVAQLLAERAVVTLRLILAGIIGGWVLGLALAVPAAVLRAPLYDLASTAFSGAFLCV